MSIAHKGAVVGAKVMAASILDLLTSPELRAAAKNQFEEDTKDSKYFSLLPPGAKPPLDLNREMMEKYRPDDAEILFEQESGVQIGGVRKLGFQRNKATKEVDNGTNSAHRDRHAGPEATTKFYIEGLGLKEVGKVNTPTRRATT